jgi:insulysin
MPKPDFRQSCMRAGVVLAVLALVMVAGYRWVFYTPDLIAVPDTPPLATTSTAIHVIKSENDKRDYQYLTLENGLRVLLVSDPHTDIAAASLNVATGSRDDPANRQGLAHFLEHMLFLGTEKYPKAGEYQSFVSAHGGQHNAYTSLEDTNYFFDVDPVYFPEALDRFAQFFIAPLFTADYVQREKNAVDSEYQAKIRDDGRRQWDVMRELYDPENPAARFAVGNLATLSDQEHQPVRDDLLSFWQKNYSANVMTLVVLGPQPLPDLQKLVQTRFAAVANHGRVLDNKVYPIFRDKLLPARVQVQSVQDRRVLQLVFPLPPMLPFYREKPDTYLGYLLGHEGEGSLFQALRLAGWADRLSAGTGLSGRFGATFNVSIELTEEGYRHIDDVTMQFFQTVASIKKQGIHASYFDEQRKILDLTFRYVEKNEAVSYVSALAGAMQHYAPQDTLRGDYLMASFDEKLLHKTLDQLKPDNMLMAVSAPEPVSDKPHLSAFYNTPYTVSPIPDETLSLWSRVHLFKAAGLPERNPFIPDQLKVKNAILLPQMPGDVPVNLTGDKTYDLWFIQDRTFNVPKASIMVYARSPHLSATARHGVKAELFVRLLQDHLNPLLYTASQAGLDFVITKRSRGIAFQVMGFNDKQGLLLKSVLDTFRSPVFNEARYDLVKAAYTRELQNASKKTPYQQVMQDIPVSLVHGYWDRQRNLKELESITLAEVQDYVLDYTQALTVDVLVYGNFYPAEAQKLAHVIDASLNLDQQRVVDTPSRVVELPPVNDPLLYIDNLEHDDSAMVKYLQAADDSISSQVKTELLTQILKADFFHSLRTEQQTGYIVNCASMPLARVPGLAFLVQSPTVGVGEIHRRVDAFIQQQYPVLEKMDDAGFEAHRQALMVQLSEKPKNLSEQALRYWNDMTLEYTAFDHEAKQIEVLKQLTKADMLAFYRDILLQQNRRELLVVSPGKAGIQNLLDGSAEQYILIDDVDKVKAQMPSHVLK